MSGSHLSKDFFDLVKSIGESRSKQEEDKIVIHEVQTLKQKMAAKDVPPKKMKEYLIRMIYVEMLGHDASFGHIHAVKMVHTRTLLEKRVGYLAVALTLHPDHSFMLLLINTIQTDLKSDNYLEVSMALTVVCKLVNAETMPALLPLVVKLLDHKEGNVKKKAVMALHRFHQIDPSSVASLQPQIRKALCDSNISVMGTALCLFVDLCAEKPSLYKDLVPDFVSILKQVIEHRLPRDYDYHRMPAPWIQLKLLQILALLGNADKAASEGMYEILHEVMKRADIGINVGYAIVYECVRTVTSIYPNTALIEDAAMSIARFITSDNHNLKYLGVNSLASIVQIDSKYAAEHQMTVIDCLEDPDETLKRKTLDLLYSMTNPANVTVIVDKLTNYLRSTTDVYLRTELVSRINQLAEKYAPNNAWFIRTMNDVFELGGELVRPEMALNLMRLISENAIDGSEEDIRVYAADIYIGLMERDPLPDILVQVIAWVLGEFGHMSRSITRMELITRLCSLMERPFKDLATRAWVLSAVMKQVADMSEMPKQVRDLATRYQNSIHVDLQQRAHEFLELTKTPTLMKNVIPLNSTTENIVVDESLSFLNGYVSTALNNGAKPYKPRNLDEDHHETKNEHRSAGLIFTPYAATQSVTEHVYDNKPTPTGFPLHDTAPVNNTLDTGLRLSGVTRKWGPTGYVGDDLHSTSTPAPAPTPAAAAYAATVAAPAAATTTPAPVYQEERPKPQKQPERRRSLTEKEKLASSLFAGIGGSTTTSTPAPAPARSTVNTRTQPQPQQQPQHVQHHAPAPTPASVVDLLSGTALETATRTQAPAPAASSGPLDLMGFADAVPVVTTPAPKPGTDNLFDIFGSSTLDTSTSNTSTSIFPFSENKSNGHIDKMGESAISHIIQAKISTFPRAPPQEVVAINDSRVQLSYYKSYAPDHTYFVLFLSNKTGSPLQNVSLAVTLPSQSISMNVEGDPHATLKPGTQVTQQVLYWSAVQPKQTITQLIGLQVRDLSLFRSPLSLTLSLSFSGSQPLPASLPFDVLDLLRPASMKTDQYGQNWKLFTEEQKSQIRPSSCTTAAEFMSRASSIARIYPVQTIGSENIVAGRLVGSGTGAVNLLTPAQHGLLCFVHGKVTTHIDLIVRTKAAEFTQTLTKALQVVFK